MTRQLLIPGVFFFILFIGGCRSRQQTTNQDADSTASVTTETESAADIAITGRLADLGLTPNSDWRGVSLGDAFATVKATEKGESFEADAEHIGYTIELEKLETADVLYYQTNNTVSAIDVDLFLNSRQSVTDYQRELAPYFDARYGESATRNGSSTAWKGANGKMVSVNDVSKGKDFGLKIRIARSTGPTTASVK